MLAITEWAKRLVTAVIDRRGSTMQFNRQGKSGLC